MIGRLGRDGRLEKIRRFLAPILHACQIELADMADMAEKQIASADHSGVRIVALWLKADGRQPTAHFEPSPWPLRVY